MTNTKNINIRLLKNLMSFVFNLSNRQIIQLILYPILINFYSSENFGKFISIIALANMLSFIGQSYFSYYSNYLAIYFRRKSNLNVNKFFKNYTFFFFRKISLIYILYLMLILLLNNLNIFFFSFYECLYFIVFLISSFINQHIQSLFTIYRFLKKTYLAQIIVATIAFIVNIILICKAIFFKISFLEISLIFLFINLLQFIFLSKFLIESKFKLNFLNANNNNFKLIDELKKIKGFIIKNFSDYLVLDFIVIIITFIISPNLSSIYLMHRIAGKFINVLLNLISNTLTNESGNLYSNKNFKYLKSITLKIFFVSILLLLSYYLIFYFFGSIIFDIWTNNKIKFSILLFTNIFIANSLEQLWKLISSLAYGTNKHNKISFHYFFSTCAMLILFTISIKYLTIEISLIFMILSQVYMLIVSLINFSKL